MGSAEVAAHGEAYADALSAGDLSRASGAMGVASSRPSVALDADTRTGLGPGSGGAGGGADDDSELPFREAALGGAGMEDLASGYGGPAPAPELRLAEAVTTVDASEPSRASDATSAPLLVYTGELHVAVYQVREAQERIALAATELGGFVASQTDDSIVIRVPAPRFFDGIERVSGTGDVLHRDVRTTDVSEEFRDNDIRLRNLEVMRGRLEELLARATDVEDALRVERELERVTVELERLRGRQRFLTDRITLSTIGVSFRVLEGEDLNQPEIFNLPFGWLRALGLPTLLRVD